jgi:hypothetical protein
VRKLSAKYPRAEADARALASVNIIRLEDSPTGPMVNLTDARLIELWGEMRKAGFVEGTGFPPEIVSFYVEASEYVAANEAEKFLARTEGKIGAEEAAIMLQKALTLMLDFFGLLRFKAFMRNIHAATQEGAAVNIPSLPKPPKVRRRGERARTKKRA